MKPDQAKMIRTAKGKSERFMLDLSDDKNKEKAFFKLYLDEDVFGSGYSQVFDKNIVESVSSLEEL